MLFIERHWLFNFFKIVASPIEVLMTKWTAELFTQSCFFHVHKIDTKKAKGAQV